MNTNEAKQTVAFALGELRHSLEAGRSESLQRYLDFISKFNRYSFHNTMLIMAQCPVATMVAGFSTWKKLGRYVKQGETGIQIYAPMVGRYRSKPAESDKGRDYTKRDRLVPESERDAAKQQAKQSGSIAYRMVGVFDISQTEGKELAELSRFSNHGLVGNPGACLQKLEMLFKQVGIALETKEIPGLTRGYSVGNYVAVREGLKETMRFRVLVHELAHSIMHFKKHNVPGLMDIYMGPPAGKSLEHSMEELEAESVAYTVCRACGVDSSAISSDYITLHAGDSRMLANSMTRIQTAASRILEAMDQQSPWQAVESRMAA